METSILMNFVMAHVALGTNMVQYFKDGDTLDVFLNGCLTKLDEGVIIKTDEGYDGLGLRWVRI